MPPMKVVTVLFIGSILVFATACGIFGEASNDDPVIIPSAREADLPAAREATPDHRTAEASIGGRRSGETQQGRQMSQSYTECLDDVYLRASDDYDGAYWLAAAIWYCRDLEPTPSGVSFNKRCNLDLIETSQSRYPEWEQVLHLWHSIGICGPLPTADTTHIGATSDSQPTAYGACLDHAYLGYVELIGSGDVTLAISAWMCRAYLPDPPATHRQRCDLNRIAETQELFPEWPDRLHNWHAIMQCLPEWKPNTSSGEDSYSTCLGDVYWQVADRFPKDHAIPAAVWRCRDHMPESPSVYSHRCELNHLRRDEESELQWPGELYAWNAIVRCYPEYDGPG